MIIQLLLTLINQKRLDRRIFPGRVVPLVLRRGFASPSSVCHTRFVPPDGNFYLLCLPLSLGCSLLNLDLPSFCSKGFLLHYVVHCGLYKVYLQAHL